MPPQGLSWTRRECLRAGLLGMGACGLSLPRLLQADLHRSREQRDCRADRCILLFLDGGPSHLDMWDMKPAAPAGIRGEFQPVSTSLSGYQICEHLPRLARQMHLATVVRSMHHTVNNSHGAAVYTALTGHDRGEAGGLAAPTDHPHMGAVLAEMEEKLFPALGMRQTAMPVVPPPARQSTLNINAIHGGLAEPEDGYTGFPSALVPDRCVITIDRRYLIEEDPADVKAEIDALMRRVQQQRDGFEYEIRDLFEVHPIMTSAESPIAATVATAIEAVLGDRPEFVVSPGTYDQKHIDRIGRLQNCIAYGPGILELAHQPDEWVGINDMLDSAKVMAHALMALLADPDQP